MVFDEGLLRLLFFEDNILFCFRSSVTNNSIMLLHSLLNDSPKSTHCLSLLKRLVMDVWACDVVVWGTPVTSLGANPLLWCHFLLSQYVVVLISCRSRGFPQRWWLGLRATLPTVGYVGLILNKLNVKGWPVIFLLVLKCNLQSCFSFKR